MSATEKPVEVFCSYAPEDEKWLDKLKKHLSSLERQGLISLWHHRRIVPGTDWRDTIDARLEISSVILFLVSADFIASDYCYGVEMRRAMERYATGKARVIPILLRSTDWEKAPFAHLQPLPANGEPLSLHDDKDAALTEIAIALRKIIAAEPSRLVNSIARSDSSYFGVPYPGNEFFTGREDDLHYLRQQLLEHKNVAIGQKLAISGLGGVGKTSLAVQYAYRYRSEYAAVLWGYAETLDTLNVSYRKIALLLNLPGKDAKEIGVIVEAVKKWLNEHQDYLLILDNLENSDVLTTLVPSQLNGHLLITTRLASLRSHNVSRMRTLEMLTPEQGALLLLRRAGWLDVEASLTQASPDTQMQAQELSELLGGLPLALEQAGAYIDATGTNLTSYRQSYERSPIHMLGKNKPHHYQHTVATTWLISFERVEEHNPAAADLLRFCSFLAPDTISESLLIHGVAALDPERASVTEEPSPLDQACLLLKSYSLIKRDPYQRIISIHRLVQAVVRENLAPEQRRIWAERAIGAMHKVMPSSSSIARQKWLQEWSSYSPQIQVCAHLIKEYAFTSIEAIQLLNQAGTTFGIQQEYQQSLSFYKQALEISERVLGPTDVETAGIINELAMLYRSWAQMPNHYEEAQKMYERALSIRESVLGPEHPDTAETLDKLGMLYRIWEKYERAEQFFKRALRIREQNVDLDAATATTLNNLAVLYRLQGKYAQARSLLERTLSLREKTPGSEDSATATTINNIAYLYLLEGKHEQSLETYQRALAIRAKVFGRDHPNTTITDLNIGQLYRDQGAYEQAKEYMERALTTHERALGSKHSKVVSIRAEYQALLHMLGQHQSEK